MAKTMNLCTARDCRRPARSGRALYCGKHYQRLKNTGSLDDPEIRRRTGKCSIEGCDKGDSDGVLCAMHATRQRRHGSPHTLIPVSKRQYPRGSSHPAWAGSEVSYSAAHQRIYRARGKASTQICIDCGGAAGQWSYDHEDPAELTTVRGHAYSVDVAHYVPRCVPCHKRTDLDLLKHSWEN